jgi:hypothetical protein
MWQNIVELDRPQRRQYDALHAGLPKATNAHTGRVILTALLLQQWLHGQTPILRSMHNAHLVLIIISIVLLHVWYTKLHRRYYTHM